MNCAFCGKEMIGKHQLKFCSIRCQHNDRIIKSQEKRKRICKTCGKEFVMPFISSRAKLGKDRAGIYCSKKCRWEYERNEVYCKVFFNSCVICGKLFVSKRLNIKYCSDKCIKEMNRLRGEKHWKILSNKYDENGDVKERNCKECNSKFTPEYGNKSTKFCSRNCLKKYMERTSRAIRRSRKHGNKYEYFDPHAVFIRDGWRCQLCRVNTPKRLRGTVNNDAPELDHIVPLALGGEHTMKNTQCLCRRCNQSKGATIRGQLRLFG